MNQQIIEILKIVITTFICSALIMPFMKRIAKHIGAMDIPRSDEGHRHIHTKATPKLGGVGIFLAFLIGYMLFGEQTINLIDYLDEHALNTNSAQQNNNNSTNTNNQANQITQTNSVQQ